MTMTQKINHPDMVRVLAKSGADIRASLTDLDCHKAHMIWGLWEVSEIVGYEDAANLIEELGDFEFYFEGLRQGYGFTYEQTLIALSQIDPSSFNADSYLTYGEQLLVVVGNLADLVKKEVIYRKHVESDTILHATAAVQYFLNQFYEHHVATREDAINGNIEKLSKRYEGFKYSDAAAQARADKDPEKNTDESDAVESLFQKTE